MLDRSNKEISYVCGRMAAIVQQYAGDKFGPCTLEKLIYDPGYYVSVFIRYVPDDDQYYNDIKDIPLPLSLKNKNTATAWIGYYHQRSAYDKNKH